jgi:transposase
LSHGRRKFFDLAKAGEAPIATEAVRRIDDTFAISAPSTAKRRSNGLLCAKRNPAPIITDVEIWMRQQRTLLSSNNDALRVSRHREHGFQMIVSRDFAGS